MPLGKRKTGVNDEPSAVDVMESPPAALPSDSADPCRGGSCVETLLGRSLRQLQQPLPGYQSYPENAHLEVSGVPLSTWMLQSVHDGMTKRLQLQHRVFCCKCPDAASLWPCRPTISVVSRKTMGLGEILGAGRVEQRSSGGAGRRVSAEGREATEECEGG